MREPFIALLKHSNRIPPADSEFAAKLNSLARDIERVGKDIVTFWNELERDWPPDYSDLQNKITRKEVTLTPGELADVRSAITATKSATSTKELTMDDAFRNLYNQYRWTNSRFTALRLYNTKMLRELTTIATIAKTKK